MDCILTRSINANSSINNSELSDFYYIIRATYLIENYAIRAIAITGVVLNIFSMFVLKSRHLSHRIYNYIWCRSFCNMIVCLFGSTYIKNCYPDCETTYGYVFYQWFINGIPMRIAFAASVFSDGILIINRLLIMHNQSLKLMSKLSNLTFSFMIPILLAFPTYFTVNIVETETTGLFKWEFSEFGLSNYFKIYAIFLMIFETLLPIIILTIINIISVKKFHEINEKKRTLTNNTDAIKRADLKYFKMVAILITICIFTRVLDLSSGISQRINGLFGLDFTLRTQLFIALFRQITYLIIFATYAYDWLIYFIMDNNLMRVLEDYFSVRNRVRMERPVREDIQMSSNLNEELAHHWQSDLSGMMPKVSDGIYNYAFDTQITHL